MTSEGEADQKAEKNTLGEFFENNKRFLSALGLLAALTIFATNTEIEILGAVLSSMLLAATVILGMELWEKFRDSAPATAKMTGLGFTLTVALFVMAFYWLLLLQDLWRWANDTDCWCAGRNILRGAEADEAGCIQQSLLYEAWSKAGVALLCFHCVFGGDSRSLSHCRPDSCSHRYLVFLRQPHSLEHSASGAGPVMLPKVKRRSPYGSWNNRRLRQYGNSTTSEMACADALQPGMGFDRTIPGRSLACLSSPLVLAQQERARCLRFKHLKLVAVSRPGRQTWRF